MCMKDYSQLIFWFFFTILFFVSLTFNIVLEKHDVELKSLRGQVDSLMHVQKVDTTK